MARNLGIDKSTAEWIAFLDAHDVWIPGKLQAQVTAAQDYGAGFVCASVSTRAAIAAGRIAAQTLAHDNYIATNSVLVKSTVRYLIRPVYKTEISYISLFCLVEVRHPNVRLIAVGK